MAAPAPGAGADGLPAPDWKEKRLLGDRLDEQVRLACQLWLTADVELTQDGVALAPAPAKVATP